MTTLVTEAAYAANTIGAHTHPVLEEGNLSFPSGRYVVGFQGGSEGGSFTLSHRVEGASLIPKMIASGEARCGCIVASPRSFYRRVLMSPTATQEVRWAEDDMGEPPLFTPVVLCVETSELVLDADMHEVHPAWHGVRVRMRRGARLAVGNVFDLRSSVTQLIRVEADETIDGNRFQVTAQSEPFGFIVKASPSLHRYLSSRRADATRSNILTHIVTSCFALLQRNFSHADAWDRTLRRLAEHIGDKYPYRWDDEDFSPEAAAMALYPHVLPEEDRHA